MTKSAKYSITLGLLLLANLNFAGAQISYVPASSFQMGDTFNEGYASERPLHSVYVSAFFMDDNLISRELWLDVYTWAIANGYTFDNAGSFKNANHPVHTVSWFDAVKWCNARSQKEGGLTHCYYTDAGLTVVYKAGQVAPYVKTNASGYRLPTEAEWEKAARGGLSSKRFPSGDLISQTNANYYANTSFSYDLGPNGYNPIGSIGGTSPATSPVGSFAANGYGLKDMAGNLWEWCWDWYDGNWYANNQAIQDNTRGPTSGSYRLMRGGNWGGDAKVARCAMRHYYAPSGADPTAGFRCVRRSSGLEPTAATVRASQQSGTKLVNITYDVADGDSSRLNVTVAVSTNNGTSYNLPATSFSGTGYGASVTPGNNRQIVWNAGADWNNKLSSQVRFHVTASDGSGSSSADSPAVTVDTGNIGNRPIVQDVTSAYCGGGKQRVYFLNGVSLNQTFTVSPEWNGKTPSSIKFIDPMGAHPQGGTQTTRTYNVGTDFGVGGTLTVVLVASDGTESLPYPVQLDVIPVPPDINGSDLYVVPLTLNQSLRYALASWAVDLSRPMFALESGPITGSFPWLGGQKCTFGPELSREVAISGDGTTEETFKLGVDAAGKFKKGLQLGPIPIRPKMQKTGSIGYAGKTVRAYSSGAGWEVRSSSYGIEFGVGMRSPDMQLGATPFYWNFGAEINNTLALEATQVGPTDRIYSGRWDGELELEVALGTGLAWVAGAEVWGRGAVSYGINFSDELRRIGARLEAGVRVKVLGGLYQHEQGFFYWSWETNLVVSPSMVGLMAELDRPETVRWTLAPRGYLSDSTPYSHFLTKEPVLQRWGDPVVSQTPLELQTNIWPYSEAALAVSGPNRLLLLVTDNTNRIVPENRTELICSKWNGSTWMNPTSVWDDATADFSPTVKLFPDGSGHQTAGGL